MRIILCALTDGIGSAMRSVSGDDEEYVHASDATEALRLMDDESASVVLVGGTSNKAIAESCKQLRAAKVCRDAVIVAASGGADDVPALIAAGADDFFDDSLGGGIPRSRLLVAESRAADIASRRASEEEREHFVQLSPSHYGTLGFDGFFRTLNPSWTRVLGWSSAEMMAEPLIAFIHPDDREGMRAAEARLGGGQAVVGLVNRCRRKDGTYRWLEWQAAPSVERSYSYALARDVTDATTTREELRWLSETLATTLDSIGDGVIAMDLAGRITRMNPVAEQLTGWTLAEASGKELRQVLDLRNDDARVVVENPFTHALRENASVTLPAHTSLTRRDGTEIPIADSCAPIRANDGTVNGAVLVFRDLTAQRNADAAKARVQKQLIVSDRMASVGTLAAGVAHEINNPLSYVSANVEMAIAEVHAQGVASPSARIDELEDMLRAAQEGVVRITRIVRGLKTFSRVDEERPVVLDVIPVIELAIQMAFNEIRHRARLVKDYGKIPLVEADDARLGQVFINLLVNAAHALPDGNTDANEIRVTTSTDDHGRAVIEIRDTGSGIAPALLDRIFDPFFTTKAIGVGTGLGLAITHNIVTGMGGEISVESALGRGTTFRVSLPPSASNEPSVPPGKTRLKSTPTKQATVLVVDDEPLLGTAIRRILGPHHVTVVTTAQAALDLLAAGTVFDVVLTDLMMPGMSGMELYTSLSRLYPQLASKVILLTGGAFTPEAKAFLDRVDNERMEKPFDPHCLRELVEKVARVT